MARADHQREPGRDFFHKVGAPQWIIERALAGDLHWAGLRAAVANALGTDMYPHEPFERTSVTVRELEFLVQAGMAPVDALRAGTSHAAQMLGRADVGAVEPGKLADLIVVGGDPLADISALRDLRCVVCRGRIVRSPLARG
jgi:imidazolonepropionase-like amidohydrolase